ncbi:MAG: PD40 domain-containing protein [Candidatus Omnitrophica bacterium]|nr:PD40 domain-containing protein [Candidatus Omnitrophota bacterium]
MRTGSTPRIPAALLILGLTLPSPAPAGAEPARSTLRAQQTRNNPAASAGLEESLSAGLEEDEDFPFLYEDLDDRHVDQVLAIQAAAAWEAQVSGAPASFGPCSEEKLRHVAKYRYAAWGAGGPAIARVALDEKSGEVAAFAVCQLEFERGGARPKEGTWYVRHLGVKAGFEKLSAVKAMLLDLMDTVKGAAKKKEEGAPAQLIVDLLPQDQGMAEVLSDLEFRSLGEVEGGDQQRLLRMMFPVAGPHRASGQEGWTLPAEELVEFLAGYVHSQAAGLTSEERLEVNFVGPGDDDQIAFFGAEPEETPYQRQEQIQGILDQIGVDTGRPGNWLVRNVPGRHVLTLKISYRGGPAAGLEEGGRSGSPSARGLLEVRDPLGVFLSASEARRLAQYLGGHSFPREEGQKKVIAALRRRQADYGLRKVVTLETLPRLARFMIAFGHPGISLGKRGSAFPSPTLEEVVTFCRYCWDPAGKGSIPKAVREEIVEKVRARRQHRVILGRDLSDDSLKGDSARAFQEIERVVRALPTYARLRRELTRQRRMESSEKAKEAPPPPALRPSAEKPVSFADQGKSWHEFSLRVVDELIRRAPLEELQPVGAGTSLRIRNFVRFDQEGGKAKGFSTGVSLGKLREYLALGDHKGLIVRWPSSRRALVTLHLAAFVSGAGVTAKELKKREDGLRGFLERLDSLQLFGKTGAGLEELEFAKPVKDLRELASRPAGALYRIERPPKAGDLRMLFIEHPSLRYDLYGVAAAGQTHLLVEPIPAGESPKWRSVLYQAARRAQGRLSLEFRIRTRQQSSYPREPDFHPPAGMRGIAYPMRSFLYHALADQLVEFGVGSPAASPPAGSPIQVRVLGERGWQLEELLVKGTEGWALHELHTRILPDPEGKLGTDYLAGLLVPAAAWAIEARDGGGRWLIAWRDTEEPADRLAEILTRQGFREDPPAEEPAEQVSVEQLLSGKHPLSDFLLASEAKILHGAVRGSLRSATVVSRATGKKKLDDVVRGLKERQMAHEKEGPALGRLRRLPRIIFRHAHSLQARTYTHFPEVEEAHVKEFALRSWDPAGRGRILPAERSRLQAYIRERMPHGETAQGIRLSPEAFAAAFSDVEECVRALKDYRDLCAQIRRDRLAGAAGGAKGKTPQESPRYLRSRARRRDAAGRWREQTLQMLEKMVGRLGEGFRIGRGRGVGLHLPPHGEANSEAELALRALDGDPDLTVGKLLEAVRKDPAAGISVSRIGRGRVLHIGWVRENDPRPAAAQLLGRIRSLRDFEQELDDGLLSPKTGLEEPGPITILQKDPARVTLDLAFSPDGRYLAWASSLSRVHRRVGGRLVDESGIPGRHQIRVKDLSTGEVRSLHTGHTHFIWQIRFSPDGRLLASLDEGGNLFFWRLRGLRSGAEPRGVRVPLKSPADAVHPGDRYLAMAFTRDGKTLFLQTHWGKVHLFKVTADGVEKAGAIPTPGGEEPLFRPHLELHPRGEVLAFEGPDRGIRLWSFLHGKFLGKDVSESIAPFAFHPDGDLLAAAAPRSGHEWAIRLWDPWVKRVKGICRGHWDIVLSLAFSPDGDLLASAGKDGSVRVWDVGSGEVKAVLNAFLIPGIDWRAVTHNKLSFSPDGKTLAVASAGFVWTWKVGERLVVPPERWREKVAELRDEERDGDYGDLARVELLAWLWRELRETSEPEELAANEEAFMEALLRNWEDVPFAVRVLSWMETHDSLRPYAPSFGAHLPQDRPSPPPEPEGARPAGPGTAAGLEEQGAPRRESGPPPLSPEKYLQEFRPGTVWTAVPSGVHGKGTGVIVRVQSSDGNRLDGFIRASMAGPYRGSLAEMASLHSMKVVVVGSELSPDGRKAHLRFRYFDEETERRLRALEEIGDTDRLRPLTPKMVEGYHQRYFRPGAVLRVRCQRLKYPETGSEPAGVIALYRVENGRILEGFIPNKLASSFRGRLDDLVRQRVADARVVRAWEDRGRLHLLFAVWDESSKVILEAVEGLAAGEELEVKVLSADRYGLYGVYGGQENVPVFIPRSTISAELASRLDSKWEGVWVRGTVQEVKPDGEIRLKFLRPTPVPQPPEPGPAAGLEEMEVRRAAGQWRAFVPRAQKLFEWFHGKDWDKETGGSAEVRGKVQPLRDLFFSGLPEIEKLMERGEYQEARRAVEQHLGRLGSAKRDILEFVRGRWRETRQPAAALLELKRPDFRGYIREIGHLEGHLRELSSRLGDLASARERGRWPTAIAAQEGSLAQALQPLQYPGGPARMIVEEFTRRGADVLLLSDPQFTALNNPGYGEFLAAVVERLAVEADLRRLLLPQSSRIVRRLQRVVGGWIESGIPDFWAYLRRANLDPEVTTHFASGNLPSHWLPAVRIAVERGIPVVGFDPREHTDLAGLPKGDSLIPLYGGETEVRMANRVAAERQAAGEGGAVLVLAEARHLAAVPGLGRMGRLLKGRGGLKAVSVWVGVGEGGRPLYETGLPEVALQDTADGVVDWMELFRDWPEVWNVGALPGESVPIYASDYDRLVYLRDPPARAASKTLAHEGELPFEKALELIGGRPPSSLALYEPQRQDGAVFTSVQALLEPPQPPADLFRKITAEALGGPWRSQQLRYDVTLWDENAGTGRPSSLRAEVVAFPAEIPSVVHEPKAMHHYSSIRAFRRRYGASLREPHRRGEWKDLAGMLRRLRRILGWQASDGLRRRVRPQVWVVRARPAMESVTTVCVYVQARFPQEQERWESAVRQGLVWRQPSDVTFLVRPYPEDGVLATSPQIVIRQTGADLRGSPHSDAPILTFDREEDVKALLKPGLAYALAVTRALEGKVIGRVVYYLAFTPKGEPREGETFYAIFDGTETAA